MSTDPQTTGLSGRALVLAAASAREAIRSQLQSHNLDSEFIDDPYEAAAVLVSRPLAFRAIVLSLQSLYRSELTLIKVLRERLPHLDVILTHTDGRSAALAEAMRLGATALLGDDGIHRLADPFKSNSNDDEVQSSDDSNESSVDPNGHDHLDLHPNDSDDENHAGEPILTADELRALLHDSNAGE